MVVHWGSVCQSPWLIVVLSKQGWREFWVWIVTVSVVWHWSCEEMNGCHAVPVIVVFTKYDTLVMSEIYRAGPDILKLGDENKIQLHGMKKADEIFKKVCINPLVEISGDMQLARVSGWCTISLNQLELRLTSATLFQSKLNRCTRKWSNSLSSSQTRKFSNTLAASHM